MLPMKRLFIFLLLILPLSTIAQEKVRKNVVGPYEGKTRILISFVEVNEDKFKMQSLIIDVEKSKSKDNKPQVFLADLTTTVRSMATGSKDQKILVLRLQKSGELELKCNQKWTKQETIDSEMSNVLEVIKSVIQSISVDAKEPTEFDLEKEIEEKVITVLENLGNAELPCVRKG